MKLTAALFVIAAASPQALAFAPTTPTSRPITFLNSVLSKVTGRSSLDPAVIARYDALPFPSDTILAEYVWVDADGNTRSKTRTLPAAKAESVESLPKWNFDGSSTGQAPGDDSEVILRPCRIFKDPFRPRSDGLDNILVMCDTWTPAGEPLPTNSRAIGTSHWSLFWHWTKGRLTKLLFYHIWISICFNLPTNQHTLAEKAFAGKEDEETWFGLEQEFTLFNLDERTPLGWPEGGMPSRPQGPYYCSVGPENNFGRAITDAMYKASLYAGIAISGVNGEVMPGQQEYQGA
jgi:glutamine synthetase